MTAVGVRRGLVGREPTVLAVTPSAVHDTGLPMAALLALDGDAFHEVLDDATLNPPVSPAPDPLPPVDVQEVWASGVTYERSKDARIAESDSADAYVRIYDAERPELFMKATASRVPAPGAALRIRADSTWDVPEPELGLVLNAGGEVLGYLVGNDMSSRSIEAENPLYLPQAKVFDDAIGLSGTIALARAVGDGADLTISLTIRRNGQTAFTGHTSTARMHRTYDELREHLFRELSFPHGAVLLTGTGLVPPDEFTLAPGDRIEITIDRVGTLSSEVYRMTTSRTPAEL
jgi:2-dehydro-3-deoxy-D-arabinonate dehydratase